jgi:hypothetical protein
MKKIKYYLILSLIFFIASCQKDNEIEFTELGTEFLISGSYTSLDNEVTILIENQQKNLSEIKLTHLGGLTTNLDADDNPIPFSSDYTATIPISNGAGELSIPDDDLGMTEIGWSADFQLDATYDGKAIQRFYTLTVDDPISVDVPEIKHRTETLYFKFAIAPTSATVENVTVQSKVSALGTYTSLPGPFNAEDSIPINGADYNIDDTLFVNIIGTVGTKTASTETEIIILSDITFDNLDSFILNDTADQAFDFISTDFVTATSGGENADIELTASYTLNGLIIGFISNQNAEFVAGTDLDYEYADSLAIVTTDFSAAIKFNDNVSGDEVYIFRTKRGSDPYFYGIMKLIKVDKPQGVLEDSYIEIEYKYY